MEWFLRVNFFILGNLFGSFVNMLVFRTAAAYRIIKPGFKVLGRRRSVCDHCGKQLGWQENLPVVSFLAFRGKSRCCGKKLPLTYPIVEAGLGLLFALVFWNISQNEFYWPVTLLEIIILVMLMFSIVFDWKYMLLPDFSNFLLIGAAGAWLFFRPDWLSYLASALGSGMFLLLLHVITRGKGMGMGDVKFAIFMGLFLGLYKTILAFYVAFVAGALLGLGLIIFKEAGRKSEIAFGPFLAMGVLVAWIWGDGILERLRLFF